MRDVDTLQMNHAKGLIESTIADLEQTDRRLKAFKDFDFRTRNHIIERLKAVQTELAELVELAGGISVEPIEPNPSTAWEVAKALVDAHAMPSPSPEEQEEEDAKSVRTHVRRATRRRKR